jgi:hypothetical protein
MWTKEELLKAIDREIERTDRVLGDPKLKIPRRVLETHLRLLNKNKQRHSASK